MRKIVLSLLVTFLAFLASGQAAKSEKITTAPLLGENALDTFGLDRVGDIIDQELTASGLFTVQTQEEIDKAQEFGIDPITMQTNLTIEYGVKTADGGSYLNLFLKNKSELELNRVKVQIADAGDKAQIVAALAKLLPVLQAAQTCDGWKATITSEQTLPMQEAMTELAYRLLDCHLANAAYEQSPYLKYANTKTHAAMGTLLGIGSGSFILAAAGWCWVGGVPDDVAGWVLGGVFTAVMVGTLIPGISLGVKYHRGVKERKALELEKPKAALHVAPAISRDYQGLQLALTW